MKKQLNGWQIALLLIGTLAAYFAFIFGAGWLLSKASWLERLEGWERRMHFGWWVFFGVRLILSPFRLKEKHPRLARIGSICGDISLIFLGVEGALKFAFDISGI